jgi:hypothetical protein
MLTDLLIDNRGLLLIVTILAWAWFIWAILRNLKPATSKPSGRAGSTNRVALPRKPADVVPLNRTSTGGLAPSIEAGMVEHQVRSSAPTAKLSTQPPGDKVRPTEGLGQGNRSTAEIEIGDVADSDAKDDLFSGLKTEEPTGTREATPAMHRSERMQEIGFHHPIESEKVMPATTPPPMAESAPPAVVPKGRTQTAELDDILKRIDQVLADNPPPATENAVKSSTPVLPARPVEKLDPSDVLKRIDEALAEGHGGRASQMTMPRPDWEEEAKRVASGEVPVVKAPIPPATAPVPAPPTKPPTVNVSKTGKTAVVEDLPDWAKTDIQDEDLPAKPATTDTKAETKSDSDGKGDPGQQRLF